MREIPYRQLLLMKKDKLRPCYGKKIIETTDIEAIFGKVTEGNTKKRTVIRKKPSQCAPKGATGIRQREKKENATDGE